MAESGNDKLFTETKNNLYTTGEKLDYDKLMAEFADLVKSIKGSDDFAGETPEGKEFKEKWQPRIAQIVETYLGKGKKMKDATREQVEAIELIVLDLKELIG